MVRIARSADSLFGVEHVEWSEHPVLQDAVLLAAFTGWNDAGDAATEAVGYLTRRYECRRIATIDPEYFYDFASVRPSVRLEGDERRIDWPVNEVRLGELDDGRPLVTVLGIEPRLRWRTFSQALLTVADQLSAKTVITLGALLTDTHHQAPVDVIGTSKGGALRRRWRGRGMAAGARSRPNRRVVRPSIEAMCCVSVTYTASIGESMPEIPSAAAAS